MKKAGCLILCIVTIIVTLFSFSDIVTHPAHVILQLNGDGVKNFYTYTYHCLYDKGWWFTGLNYPYGENIVYADGLPLLSFIIIHLRQWFGLQMDSMIAIFNLSMVVGFVLGICYVYKTLVYFKVQEIWAVVFSLLIILLSPQILRVCAGHYGLSYCCVIPMLFYWFIKYDAGNKLKYVGYMLALTLVMAFLHPYFIAVYLLLMVFYSMVSIAANKQLLTNRLLHIVPLFISIGIVFVAVKLVMHVTDPVTDRPSVPWGFMSYFTELNDIVRSPYTPFRDHSIPADYGLSEGYSYVGIVTILTIIMVLLLSVVKMIRNSKDEIAPPPIPAKWLVIASFALALSMGAPFTLRGEWLLDYFPIFRQFRTMGRFSWIFYYIVSIYAVVYLHHWYRRWLASGKKIPAYTLMVLAAMIWAAETKGYVHQLRKTAANGMYNYRVFYYWGEKDMEAFLADHQHKSADFQAIIALPYMHIGSEKLWVGEEAGEAFGQAARASMNTGLPVVNSMMSRSSWQQAFSQVRLVGGPFTNKPVLQQANRKPFLIIKHPYEHITEDERYLLSVSEYLGDLGENGMYACYPETVIAKEKQLADSIKTATANMHAEDSCMGCYTPYFIQHFDDKKTDKYLFGAGASYYAKGHSDTITIFDARSFDSSVLYEFSAWALVNNIDYHSPEFNIALYDANNKLLAEEKFFTKTATDNKDFWLRASKYFTIPATTSRIVCKIYNAGAEKSDYIAVDELLLRPANATLISKDAEGRMMVNNHNFVR